MTTRPTDDISDQNVADHAAAPGRIVVIANPNSGNAADDNELRAAFENRLDESILTWSPTTEDDPGTGQAERAVRAGTETIIACGGDGTVRAVIESVAGSTTALGVVALGTGNLLAANLALELGLDAIDDAISGPTRTLDVGTVNGERFTVMAGVGFDAAMIRDAKPEVKRRFGSIAYVGSAIRNAPAQLTHAFVDVDGSRAWSGRTAMVLVGNCGSVTGGLEVFPDARPDDGVLDVAILSATNLREWASVMWRLVRGKQQRPELVARFTGTAITVALANPMPYELDGEDRPATTTLTFGLEPDSLRVRTSTKDVEPTIAQEAS
ncbi:MAG TPA: YegS/Rv2252/BmrU family lipid kinase [Ilumatobacter sp.]|nr:YegS/Rv2252/BmrU family lipid kinase [Ilumatobacter sp.]